MTDERRGSTFDIDVETDDTRPLDHIANDDSLATILLVSRLSPTGVHPLKASEFWRVVERLGGGQPFELGNIGVAGAAGADPATLGGQPSELAKSGVAEAAGSDRAAMGGGPGVILAQDEDDLVRDWGLTEAVAERVVGLFHRATAMAFELDRLAQSGVKTITAFDEPYPRQWLARLGAKAPPLLHGAGALDLLGTPGLGVVGSREVSEAGGATAKEIARLAARRGIPLVSGGARGVDQLAMDAAFAAGGTVIGILAESLTRKLKRPDVRRAVYDGNVAMCTPYSPDAPFSAGNAMGRNKAHLRPGRAYRGGRQRRRHRWHLVRRHRGAQARLRTGRRVARAR